MFALGTSLAAACSDPDDTGNQDTGSNATSPTGSATAVQSQAMLSATASSPPNPTNVQAIYGAPVPSASVIPAASTGPAASSGPAIQPPYGVPPLPTETIGAQPVYGAPIPSDWVEQDGGAPSVDAGEGDAGVDDGGADAAPAANSSGNSVALYGAVPAP